jgi:hypothetical protein
MRFKSMLCGLATLALAATLTSGTAAFAAEPVRQRLAVPLSDPARPAHLEVSLVMGGVTVVGGGAANEVVIEAVARPDEDGEAEEVDPSRRGMRRIPNNSLGLEAEEKDNRVSINSDSWRQPIDLRVTVPTGSSVVLSTVNDGDLAVEGVEGELELHNTNGEIHVKDARGPVTAATVNGDVTVSFAKGGAAATAMAFSTLNGDVEVTLPAGFKADVRLRSDNGEIYSDFEIAMDQGKPEIEEKRAGGRYHLILGREMTGKIGGGGPELQLRTFNGDLVLRRAAS